MDAIQQRFFGREQLIGELVQGVLAPQPASFSLVGSKLIGKTQILNYLASAEGPLLGSEKASARPLRYQDERRLVIALVDCDWKEVRENLIGYIWQHLSTQLRDEEGIQLDWSEVDGQASDGRRLLHIARQLNDMDYRLILLLDNFDGVFEQQMITMDSVDELRPLTLEMALIVATEQPLHDLDRELAASPLFNVMTQLFLKLIQSEAEQEWILAHQVYYPVVTDLVDEIQEITGGHPYLLHSLDDVLREVEQMLPPRTEFSAEHFPMIRLRFEEAARLLFRTLWRKLQDPPHRIKSELVMPLIGQLLHSPLDMKQIDRAQFAIINWLINQSIVSYCPGGYQIFSPLFAEYLQDRLPATQPATVVDRSSASTPSRVNAEIYKQLTKIEAALLRYFENHSNQVIPPEQLLADVWRRPDASTRRVQEAIRRLRNQLESAPVPVGVIENDRGRGYRFVPEGS